MVDNAGVRTLPNNDSAPACSNSRREKPSQQRRGLPSTVSMVWPLKWPAPAAGWRDSMSMYRNEFGEPGKAPIDLLSPHGTTNTSSVLRRGQSAIGSRTDEIWTLFERTQEPCPFQGRKTN